MFSASPLIGSEHEPETHPIGSGLLDRLNLLEIRTVSPKDRGVAAELQPHPVGIKIRDD